MKKAHAMAALLLAAALSFSCLSIAFAADTATVSDTTVTVTKAYADLDVTAKSFYNLRYADIGSYPVVKGYNDLNAKILKDLETAFALATDKSFTDTANVFAVSYTVKNDAQFAKIDVTYKYQLTAGKMTEYSDVKTYYVDKELGKEITADDYKKGTEAAKSADETASAGDKAAADKENTNEITMVPVRQYAEKLGYSVSWDNDTKSVIVTKGSARFTVKVGVNEYLINNAIAPLESAPTNQNGTVYVPVTFFTKVLGATYSVDTNGNIVIE